MHSEKTLFQVSSKEKLKKVVCSKKKTVLSLAGCEVDLGAVRVFSLINWSIINISPITCFFYCHLIRIHTGNQTPKIQSYTRTVYTDPHYRVFL